MTRKEAIKHLRNDWFMSLGGQLCVDEDKKDAFLEAIGMGIKALRPVSREQVEKAEWIWSTGDVYICSSCGEKTHVDECMGTPIYNFCPFCMAPMTDEAVEMVMERMETIR